MTVDPLVITLLVSLILAAYGWGFVHGVGWKDDSPPRPGEAWVMTCLFVGSCGVIVCLIAGFLIGVGLVHQ